MPKKDSRTGGKKNTKFKTPSKKTAAKRKAGKTSTSPKKKKPAAKSGSFDLFGGNSSNRASNTLTSHKVVVDEDLFAQLQPQGGISFKDEKFIKTGDGYEACVYVKTYPMGVDECWMATLTNINNAVVEIDISTEDMNSARHNINRSINEHKSRFNSSKQDTDSADSANRVSELRQLYNEIAGGEVLKIITTRIFISGRTLQEVDDQVKAVLDLLEQNGFRGYVNLNESKFDWTSMYKTYTQQQESPYHRYGQPMTTETLAAGNPFHFTSLADPYGSYFGYTDTQGTVLFDMFHLTNTRMSYNAIAVGSMGAGKSTTLKKILKDRAMRGDYVRCFDVSGEYRKLVTKLGGEIISLDGSEGVLNALEILKTDDHEETCFSRHLSKLSTLIRLLSPDISNYAVKEFGQLMRDFYVFWGLLPEDPHAEYHVTGFSADSYPTWSDFLDYLERKITKAKASNDYVRDSLLKKKIDCWDNIELIVAELVKNYGSLFDGHTSVEDITDQQIVCFNIAALKNLSSEIFDAQIFLAQSLWWDNCVRLGTKQKRLYEEHKIQKRDIVHFLGIIDEAHTMVNANKTVTLDQLLVFCREARKYFGGLIFASQSIRDFVPEGASSENVDKIKKLFELTQYKFIMRQDSNSLATLNSIFSQQLTDSELDEIPKLKKGECILAIAGDENIRFHVYVTKSELDDFAGGA